MPENTPALDLPLLAAGQSQKHVTHNEALTALDKLVHMSAINRRAAPPATLAEGDRYLVDVAPLGAFAGQAGAVAAWQDGGWRFLTPRAGWRLWLVSERRLLLHDGAVWVDVPARTAEIFGVNAEADELNRLVVGSAATLFTHVGAGVQVKLNRKTTADVASTLFQSNWSGRAEIGLMGDDRFRVKVSADGALWREALTIQPASATIAFPGGVTSGDRPGFRNRLRNAGFTIDQRAVGWVGSLAAGAYGYDGVKAGAAGAAFTVDVNGVERALTITSGSLIMPIEGSLIEGGAYTLAQDGTAQARVWQGTGTAGSGLYAAASRAAGGLTVSNLTAGTQTNVEFSVGTVLRPQLEPGPVATSFERRPRAIELTLCQRYFVASYAPGYPPASATWAGAIMRTADAATSTLSVGMVYLPVEMRASPTITLYSPSSGSSAAATNGYVQGATDVPMIVDSQSVRAFSARVNGVAVAAGARLMIHYLASAEI
jgi:hypothetical protein